MEVFAHAVQARRPDDGTWCEAWTVRDILIHQTGNAEALARVLTAHLAGAPVETRGFDRENPYRATIERDAAVRALLIWGRRPADCLTPAQ
ncbi:maleylpyruvate isomerase N-terminal domain-containing protein [Streptomyces sp. NPDC004680]|uniref:maleylpyruvate isomerase N-terminal domain-containing protein n=1 Tax=Streptomyces sp. NPDC004680 TaxID=3154287 RepID=UPI0033B84F75